MKTTLELPDDLFRSAKSTAAAQGRTLKDFFTEALKDKLRRESRIAQEGEPPWKRLGGALGKTAEEREELERIQNRIESEFRQLDDLE